MKTAKSSVHTHRAPHTSPPIMDIQGPPLLSTPDSFLRRSHKPGQPTNSPPSRRPAGPRAGVEVCIDETRRYHEPGNAICDVPELLISVRRPNAPPYRPFPSPTPRLKGTVGELPRIEGPSHSQVWEATPPKSALRPQSKEWTTAHAGFGRVSLRPQRATRAPRSNHHPAPGPEPSNSLNLARSRVSSDRAQST